VFGQSGNTGDGEPLFKFFEMSISVCGEVSFV